MGRGRLLVWVPLCSSPWKGHAGECGTLAVSVFWHYTFPFRKARAVWSLTVNYKWVSGCWAWWHGPSTCLEQLSWDTGSVGEVRMDLHSHWSSLNQTSLVLDISSPESLFRSWWKYSHVYPVCFTELLVRLGFECDCRLKLENTLVKDLSAGGSLLFACPLNS